MQVYDVLMKFDRKIIGFKFKITFVSGMTMPVEADERRRKSINKVLACDSQPS